jgi:gluconolactonase
MKAIPKLDRAAFFEGEPQLLAKDLAFVEGPVWVKSAAVGTGAGSAGFFAFCSLKNTTTDGPGTVYKIVDAGGATSDAKPEVWFAPSNGAIGLAVDHLGRIYAAEKDTRRITRRVPDGEGAAWRVTTLAEKFEDKRLNDTNDLVVTEQGVVYFTDPNFFTKKEDLQLDVRAVYRVDGPGMVSRVATFKQPNGLALSPDGQTLYVNEFSEQRVMSVAIGGAAAGSQPVEVANLRRLAELTGIPTRGGADGLRVDSQGNIYTTGPGGIWVLSSTGEAKAHLPVPSTNLAFGGPDGKTLLITASGGQIMRIRTKIPGWVDKPKDDKTTAPMRR